MKIFMCLKCGRIKFLNRWQILWHMHCFDKYVLIKCPQCNKWHWFKKIEIEGCITWRQVNKLKTLSGRD